MIKVLILVLVLDDNAFGRKKVCSILMLLYGHVSHCPLAEISRVIDAVGPTDIVHARVAVVIASCVIVYNQ